MAFNGVGFGTLGPGSTTTWWYKYGGSGDKGAQYAMAHPLNPGGSLRVTNQTKKRENNGTITYFVTIRNIGSVTTNFNLSGGGLV
jgi:hypothetical protein